MPKTETLKHVRTIADVLITKLVDLRTLQEQLHNTLDKAIANNVQLLHRIEDLEKELE